MRLKILLFALIIFIPAAEAQKINESYTNVIGIRQTSDGVEGVIANLTVEIHHGSGRVFLDTSPLTEVDTQASARLAQEVACGSLEMDCSNYDFLYVVRSDIPMIGGPSAGAAMAVATMSALTGLPSGRNIMMTGTVNPDGAIGPVGGIFEKAETSLRNGADMFLIPKGQAEVFVDQVIQSAGATHVETVPVNLVSYASQNWGFEVREVRTVEEAFKFSTGFEIKKEIVFSEEVASEIYSGIMQNLAKDLIDLNEEYTDDANKKLAGTNLESSENLEILDLINSSQMFMINAQQLYDKESYYSAASFAVSAAVNSNYARSLVGYYTTDSQNQYVSDLLNSGFANVTLAKIQILGDKEIDDINDIESIVIAIDRLRESEDIIDAAYNAYYIDDYKGALYQKSFADIRLETAYSWYKLTEDFSSTEPTNFSISALRPLVIKRIDEASNYLSYAQTISSNSFTLQAAGKLQSAQEAFNENKLVFALFEAIESRAYSNLAMEIRGINEEIINEKIDADINEVNLAIRDAEEKGVIPLLALSYVEYAKSFGEIDPVQTLIFLSYGKQFSSISEDLSNYALGDYKADDFIKTGYSIIPYTPEGIELSIQITILIIGIAIGILVTRKL